MSEKENIDWDVCPKCGMTLESEWIPTPNQIFKPHLCEYLRRYCPNCGWSEE